MTKADAISYLRPIMECATVPKYQEALSLAIEALETTKVPPSEPLTLGELRQMGGEPVWLAGRHLDRYDIYCGYAFNGMEQFYKAALPAIAYGKVWRAYRCRL